MLEIAYLSFKNSKFSGGACPQTPLKSEMSAIAYRISTIFFHSGVSYEDIIRLNRLGVCMSHSRMLNLQRQMGKFFDAKVLIWKNDAEKKLSALRFLEDLSCNQLARTR